MQWLCNGHMIQQPSPKHDDLFKQQTFSSQSTVLVIETSVLTTTSCKLLRPFFRGWRFYPHCLISMWAICTTIEPPLTGTSPQRPPVCHFILSKRTGHTLTLIWTSLQRPPFHNGNDHKSIFCFILFNLPHHNYKSYRKRRNKKCRGDLTETIGAYERLGLLELRARAVSHQLEKRWQKVKDGKIHELFSYLLNN